MRNENTLKRIVANPVSSTEVLHRKRRTPSDGAMILLK